jgi:hypothetical protein
MSSDGDVRSVRMEPRNAADCWALLVLRACAAGGNLRALRDWASVGEPATEVYAGVAASLAYTHSARTLR